MGKAKPTHMRIVLEAAIASGQLFNRDVRKAAKWALVTIDDLTARLAEAEARDLVAELRDRLIPWSRKTFGDGMRTVGICKHIEKELDEIRENPFSVEEWIDVAILALDGAWRTSVTAEEAVDVLFKKLAKIRTRTYPMPVSDDEPSEHVRGEVSGDAKYLRDLLIRILNHTDTRLESHLSEEAERATAKGGRDE